MTTETTTTTTTTKRPQPELLLDACRGIYIPRDFVECGATNWGVVPHDEKILLAGPEHGAYWDAWDAVLEEAEYVDENGTHWSLYQDGDLWAIPRGMVWDGATDWFVWPEEDDDEEGSAQ